MKDIKMSDKYVIDIPLTPKRRKSLKHFCSFINKSVRQFTAEAIEEKIATDLNYMAQSDREYIEKQLEKIT